MIRMVVRNFAVPSSSDDGTEDVPLLVQRYQEARALFLSGEDARAMELLRQLAIEGMPEAQYSLGNIYLFEGAPKPDPQ
jgi:TPR repeat protein